ncbi:hypothetical protein [Nocardia sp. CA-119907]
MIELLPRRAGEWGRYAELYDYDTDSDRITADPAAQIFTPRSA